MAELRAREAKLVQYLNEAFGKETQLETALEAHIAMATRPIYKKRLKEHLRETKGHARDVKRRIKQLGGSPEALPVPGPDIVSEAAGKVQEIAQKGVALAAGPLHAVRGTGEGERQLKNAKTEYSDEHEEIATYKAIETVAEAVGDRDTARLARGIRRQEERMASFLERLIPTLAKEVVKDEIPAAERNGGRRRSATSRSNGSSRSAGSSRGRAKSARNGSSASRKSTSSRSGSSARKSTSSRSGSSSARGKASARGRTRAKATSASRSTGSRSGAGASRRSPGRASSRSASRSSRSTAGRSKARSR